MTTSALTPHYLSFLSHLELVEVDTIHSRLRYFISPLVAKSLRGIEHYGLYFDARRITISVWFFIYFIYTLNVLIDRLISFSSRFHLTLPYHISPQYGCVTTSQTDISHADGHLRGAHTGGLFLILRPSDVYLRLRSERTAIWARTESRGRKDEREGGV